MRTAQQTLEALEELKVILEARATGQPSDPSRFHHLRRELVGDPSLRDRLPRFVRTCRTIGEFWAFIQPKFETYRDRREYLAAEFNPLLEELEAAAQSSSPFDAIANSTLEKHGTGYVLDVWQKALSRRSDDPEGAITAARTLLETTAKHVLDKLKIPYDEKADLPSLYGNAAKALNLAPEQHQEEIFRRILGGSFSVVHGLGSLRNNLSDAHGRSNRRLRPDARHAELAVNLAGPIATFLIQTLEVRTAELKRTDG